MTHTTKRVDGNSERIGRTSRNIPSGKPQRALKSSRRSARIHFVISRSCVRVTSLAPENSGNRMVSAVFITFRKSFDPHKLRLHLTPKAFFFDAFQKLPSGNTGPTHTVTHTTNCAERAKEHRRGNRFLSGALLACGSYRICAMKLPIFSAAFCCICRVAWV